MVIQGQVAKPETGTIYRGGKVSKSVAPSTGATQSALPRQKYSLLGLNSVLSPSKIPTGIATASGVLVLCPLKGLPHREQKRRSSRLPDSGVLSS